MKTRKLGPFFCVFPRVLHPTAVTHLKAFWATTAPPPPPALHFPPPCNPSPLASSPLFPLFNWNVKHDQTGFCSFLYGNEVKPEPGCLQPHPNTFIFQSQGLGMGPGAGQIFISSLTVPVCPLPLPLSNLLYEYESAAASPLPLNTCQLRSLVPPGGCYS